MKLLEAWMAASMRGDHEAFLDMMTDDVEYYWYMHARPITDKPTMRKFLRNYTAGFEQRAWVLKNRVENGDMIMVEGVETLFDKAREVLIDNLFMQVIEFKDGKISKVRDYYDAQRVQGTAEEAAA
ncbi:MAG: nuclear transport factor 2 family protein [Phenylobacterium sp.]